MPTLTLPHAGDIGPIRRKIELDPLEEPLPATAPAAPAEPAAPSQPVPEPVK